jgi:hypothetical protein
MKKNRALVLDKVINLRNVPSRCDCLNLLVRTVHGTTAVPVSGFNSDLLH